MFDSYDVILWIVSHDNWCTGTLLNRIITAEWEGMGDVGSARYELALLPPCPTIKVLSYSNCQRYSHSISKWFFRNLALYGLSMLNLQLDALLRDCLDPDNNLFFFIFSLCSLSFFFCSFHSRSFRSFSSFSLRSRFSFSSFSFRSLFSRSSFSRLSFSRFSSFSRSLSWKTNI